MVADVLDREIDAALPVAVGMATRYTLEAAADLAATTRRPVMVIASRRQVADRRDASYLGWSTEDWRRAAEATGRGRLLLARDHGGPYQHPDECAAGVDDEQATASALASLQADIEQGLELVHVDTSGGTEPVPAELGVDRCVELVTACAEHAASAGRDIRFEVGIEAQAGHVATPAELRAWLVPLRGLLGRRSGIAPVFVVAQTGTRVIDGTNTGDLARDPTGSRGRLHALAAEVARHGARLKAHNGDYLSRAGIAALAACQARVNISPELGTAQTTAVLAAARRAGVGGAVDRFCNAVVAAGYWRKWVSPGRPVADRDRVRLGGAYLFESAEFAELRDALDAALRRQGDSTRRIAMRAATAVIRRYC